jgi:adenine-specific DNA-methyltransferase
MEHKVVIEVDGGQHANPTVDAERDRFLQEGGFIVLRFWNHDVLQDTTAVADEIYRVLIARCQHHPHPSPPLEGEGEKQH